MPSTVLLIDHHDNPRDDLATTHLQYLGYDIELCCPFQGDALPSNTEKYIGAIIYGGAQNITELEDFPFLQSEIDWLTDAIADSFPIIGICLGAQLIAHCLGASVGHHKDELCEFGYYPIYPTTEGREWFKQSMSVTQAHYQHYDLPEGAIRLAYGAHFQNQAFRVGNNIFGLQFHPEVTAEIFRRWQDSDWAFYDRRGAQTRDQQNQLITEADRIQGNWFREFLEKFFSQLNNSKTFPDRVAG